MGEVIVGTFNGRKTYPWSVPVAQHGNETRAAAPKAGATIPSKMSLEGLHMLMYNLHSCMALVGRIGQQRMAEMGIVVPQEPQATQQEAPRPPKGRPALHLV